MKSRIYKFIFILFLFFSCDCFSQIISINLTDQINNPVTGNLLIKNSANRDEITEFFRFNSKGEVTAKLVNNYSKIIYEVTAFGYERVKDSIINPSVNKIYTFNYNLKKETKKLQEVVIVSEKKRFTVKDDTIKFNPSAYRDGTERKVEDLIKNLPGMEVAENGTIKYKGKTVQSVQIEGDNLFGYNYAIGTKNISVDMVEQVQAIQNFVENPLLKGIVNSDNVSINLKLKKGKLDISGNGNIGLPIGSDKFVSDNSINLLGISKKYKSFGEFGHNNIGINNSIFDYFSNSSNLDKEMNKDFFAPKAIAEKKYSSNLENKRANVNNQLNLNYNIIYRFNKKLSLKGNFFFIKDELFLIESNNTNFKSENIVYNDNIQTLKKPENKTVELKLTYNTSKKSLLEIDSKFENELINTNSTILQNQTSELISNLNSQSLFWKNKLQFTYRISDNKALQYISVFSNNNIPQNLNFNKTLFSFPGNEQNSTCKKENISNKLVLLGGGKSLRYVISAGFNFDKNIQNSNWQENNNSFSNFKNDFSLAKKSFFSEIGLTYNLNKFKFEPNLMITNFNQDFSDLTSLNLKKISISFLPNLNVYYLINPKSKIKLSGNYEESTPNAENLFTNPIVQDNRLTQKNNLSLNLLQNQNYNLSYRYDGIFNAILTDFSVSYVLKKNSYISSIEVQNNFNSITFVQYPANINNYSARFTIEKYFKFFKTSLKHSSSYSVNNYLNAINSNLRNNTSNNYNAYLFLKTTFKFPFNFENKFNYSQVNFETLNNKNTNELLNNSTKILIRPFKNFFFNFSYDYFLPNLKSNSDFTFLDFEIKFKTKQKWLNLTLTGKNLLNNKVFFQVENSDYFSSNYQSNLINRYVLLTADFTL